MSTHRMTKWLLLPAALLLVGGQAFAHKVSIFATVQGDRIEGEAYFSGGGRPRDCVVKFVSPAGVELGETRTNAEGLFSFKPVVRGDHVIVMNTGDGHRAEYVIKAEDLPADLPPAAGPAEARPPAAAASDTAAAAPAAGDRDADPRIAGEVQRAVLPLRKQLDRMESTVRLRDILGGIGYIFGLAGVVMYVRSRKRPAN